MAPVLFGVERGSGTAVYPAEHGGYTKVIAKGLVGTEPTQPDAVETFLGAVVEEQFIVEVVRDQRRWDKLRNRRKIVESFPYGIPRPATRKAPKGRHRT